MPQSPEHPIDLATVEALLGARHRRFQASADGEDPAALELVARHVDGLTTPEEAELVAAALAKDPTLAEAVALLADSDGEQKVTSLAAARRASEHRAAQRTSAAPMRTWLIAIAAALVAAIGVSVYLSAPSDNPGRVIGAGLGGDGKDSVSLTLVGVGGPKALSGSAHHGDRVAVGLDTTRPGYAAVLSVTPSGVNVVHDSGGAATLVGSTGGGHLLAGIVEVGEGCQWLVTGFSDASFPTAQLASAVTVAPPAEGTCPAPTVDAAFARSVVVTPLAGVDVAPH